MLKTLIFIEAEDWNCGFGNASRALSAGPKVTAAEKKAWKRREAGVFTGQGHRLGDGQEGQPEEVPGPTEYRTAFGGPK